MTGLLLNFIVERAYAYGRLPLSPRVKTNLAGIEIPAGVVIFKVNRQHNTHIKLLRVSDICISKQIIGFTGAESAGISGSDHYPHIFSASFMDERKHVRTFWSSKNKNGFLVRRGSEANLAAVIYGNGWRFAEVMKAEIPAHLLSHLHLGYFTWRDGPYVRSLVFNEVLLGLGNSPMSFYGVPDKPSYTNNLKKRLPPWGICIEAIFGLIVGWGGWHNIRNERRLWMGTLAFLFGMITFGYAVSQFLEWSK